MPGVTEQEIAQAKQMNLYQYMQLCEPDNFKPEGPGQFRHKGHSSLTFAEDGSWTYFKTKATGRTALNYLIEVEGVSFVLCLDNDEAGRTRTQDIIKHLDGSGKTVEDRPPPIGKDYNDTLVQVTQEYQKHCISLDDILEEETR